MFRIILLNLLQFTLKSLALANSKRAGNIDLNVSSLEIIGFLRKVSQRMLVKCGMV